MRLMVFVLKAPPPDWRTDDDEAKDRVDMQSPRQFNYSTFRQIARPAECRRRSSQMRSCKIGCLALAAYLVSLPPSLPPACCCLLVIRATATSKE